MKVKEHTTQTLLQPTIIPMKRVNTGIYYLNVFDILSQTIYISSFTFIKCVFETVSVTKLVNLISRFITIVMFATSLNHEQTMRN